ncbi:SH3-like domain-containing protein [Halosaccharopolyspora lacisalsi]|uniref:SH3-like domain-containing protein n=1 Tax=Halosaccharopolyspora lacisalsi TaxID=1000566 RepID=UPI0015FCA4A6|nr:SH3-like domain-containing protein [Halosaccharopolyspora lacisalsi]
MSRVNDVGGQQGFGTITPDPDEAPAFHADWQARVFALNSVLIRRGVYNLDEFRDAVERVPPRDYLAASYYERWLTAVKTLLREKGALEDTEPDELTELPERFGAETSTDTERDEHG